jgi:cellulose synthase/poly-beta-1,6-N-acetylglucosamine synthase-like glycosyltransferase
MPEIEIFFWLCLGLVVYAYVGYPLCLALVSRPKDAPDTGKTLSVTVVVAAHNEAAVIEKKIRNALEQDYPNLDVLVVSDGSTDSTEEIVEALVGPRVRLERQRPQRGKNEALNAAARVATSEVLLFTDANALFAPGAVEKLLRPFADPEVGLVTGRGLYGTLDAETARAVSNAYVHYETFLKERESSLGFVAAADGAIYALRRELYRALPWNQVHDLMHPIQVALEGKRSVFVPEAFTLEPPSKDAKVEFHRHVRIIAQGFLVFLGQAPRLLERGKWKELWMLGSHRPLRWLSSCFLGGALLANLALAGSSDVYRALLVLQVLFYMAALAGALGERLRVRLRLLAIPYYFCVVSAAGLSGFFHFLRGRGHASWAPTGGQ